MEASVLDELIGKLLEGRKNKSGKRVQLVESEIRQLCLVAKEIFLSQPNLLELEAPMNVCGTCINSIFLCFYFVDHPF